MHLLFVAWLALCPNGALADPFAALVDEGVLEEIERTAFEHRYAADEVAVVLTKAPGPDEPSGEALCVVEGVQVQVEGVPSEDLRVRLETACEGLRTDAPRLQGRPTQVATAPQAPPSSPVAMRLDPREVLRGVSLVVIGLLAWSLPRRLTPWGLALAALGVRLSLRPVTQVLMGVDYPYDRLLTYAGLKATKPLYGSGWAAWMDVLRPVFGDAPGRLHVVDLCLSVLLVPVVWEAVRRLSRSEPVAHVAAVALVCSPLHIALASSETMFVLVALLQAACVLGLARDDVPGAALAALAAGLVVHTRTFQVLFALVVLGELLRRRRWTFAGLGAVVVAARVVEAAGIAAESTNPAGIGVAPATVLLRLLDPRHHPSVLLDPVVTPAVVVPLVGVGVWTGLRGPRRAATGLLLALAIASTAPYLHFARDTDLLRFQLPSATWWLVLAALSWPTLSAPTHRTRARWVLALVVISWWVARSPRRGGHVHDAEYRALAEVLPGQPPATRIWWHADWDRHGDVARWAHQISDVSLVDWTTGAPQDGDLAWRGRAELWMPPAPPCAREPLWTATVPGGSGGLRRDDPPTVHLALERLSDCP